MLKFTIPHYYQLKSFNNVRRTGEVTNIKNLRLRKSLAEMLPAAIVNRSESGAPIIIPILVEGGLFLFRGGDHPRGEREW